MKTQVRKGVFETNSSSVHSLTMCSDVEYEAWKNGELWYDRYNNELVTREKRAMELGLEPGNENGEEKENEYDCRRFLSLDDFYDSDYIEQETFHQTHKTGLGEIVHAFGYFGYDG